MARACSVYSVLTKKRQLLQFEGTYKNSLGHPELKGSWLIYGDSYHGKTTFVLELCKYLTKFGRVAYNSLEEGDSESMKIAFERVNMKEVARKFILLDKEPIDEMKERMRKHKAPKIWVIDSIQYAGINHNEYKEMLIEFPNMLFIIVSHADKGKPSGSVAKKIHFDAHVKIRVEGFKAFTKSRFGGGEDFVIWEEGARKYYGGDI